MSVWLDWYQIRKRCYKNTENTKAVYYIKAKLYWQNMAGISRGGAKTGCNIIARYYNKKLIRRYGIFTGGHCKVGEGLQLPHPNGIVIGEYVKIGDNCTLYQQTTLGAKSIGVCERRGIRHEYPVLENGVIVYAGAKVIGGIKVAENTCIGANSVLLHSTEKDSVYAGIPAKKIK